mmetsp:Transcript_39713/g.58321  ORF Transcript_39713/g.58321 Transcript_39713/m.58321 type:complete len:323 (-) Transcript_39713:260-1228(-)|eukprot:CAMPEP_0195518588 /NCGR_PEP_ID=MMETSP0794_2-20130614/13271_1 /TAXON_ID=515487 /ORGANISM="Stephanopyxis turris, Strain CCMP 815" /LENGTH=322 /DNA_ID=CAMNT_0040647589 /DNA_START=34 /DNA_END=1002 /DNA_ORIENTATION=+
MEPYNELRWCHPPLYAGYNIDEDTDLNLSDPNERNALPLYAETTALLVVDVQPEYWSDCPAVRKDFPSFPKKLRETVEICRERRAKIIWVRADYRFSHSPWLVQFERIHKGKTADSMTEVPCDPTSKNFAWEEFATPQGGDSIIAKKSWSSTSDTALMNVLRGSGIDTVLLCGLITSVCVQHSAFGIFEAGYRTLVVTDACADRGKARHDAALALYGDYMYELVTADDLHEKLTEAEPVWITLDVMNTGRDSNVVRPISFSRPQSFSDLHSALSTGSASTLLPESSKVRNGDIRFACAYNDVPASIASSHSSVYSGKDKQSD